LAVWIGPLNINDKVGMVAGAIVAGAAILGWVSVYGRRQGHGVGSHERVTS